MLKKALISFDDNEVQCINYRAYIYYNNTITNYNLSDIENGKVNIINSGYFNFDLTSRFFMYNIEQDSLFRFINFRYFCDIEIKPSGMEAIVTFKFNTDDYNDMLSIAETIDIYKELDNDFVNLNSCYINKYCKLSTQMIDYINNNIIMSIEDQKNIKNIESKNRKYIYLSFYIYYLHVNTESSNFLKLIKFIYKADINTINLNNNEFNKKEKEANNNLNLIINLKDYQNELLYKAEKQNCIIFLETGLGKTIISIFLANKILDKYKSIDNNNKNINNYTKTKAVFLFKNIALLLQQANSIRDNSNYKVLTMYGGENYNSLARFSKKIEKYSIICSTPELFYKLLSNGFISRKTISLLVLDECHHCRGKDFYKLIIDDYIDLNYREIYTNNNNFDLKNCNINNNRETDICNTKILGLTASPCAISTTKKEDIENEIKKLCNNMRSSLFYSKLSSSELDRFNNISINNYECKTNTSSDTSRKLNIIYIPIVYNLKKSIDINNRANYNYLINKFKDKIYSIIYEFTEYYISSIIKSYNYSDKPIVLFNLINYSILYSTEELINDKLIGLFTNDDIYEYENFFKSMILTNTDSSNKNKNISSSYIEFIKGKIDHSQNTKTINLIKEISTIKNLINSNYILLYLKKIIKRTNLLIKYTSFKYLVNYLLEAFKILLDYLLKENSIVQLKINNIIKIMLYFKSQFEANTSTFIDFNDFYTINNFKQYNNLVNYQSDYLINIINLLNSKTNNIEDKTIIFCKERFITYSIYNCLKQYNFKINYLLGTSNNNTNEFKYKQLQEKSDSYMEIVYNMPKYSEKDLNKNIQEFKDNKSGVIIATSVAEEGLDIPNCSNVISIYPIKNIKELIQKSGRARQQYANIYLFYLNDNIENSKEFKNKENEYRLKIKEYVECIKTIKELIDNNSKSIVFNFENYVFKKYIEGVHYITPYTFKNKCIDKYNHLFSEAMIYRHYSKSFINEFCNSLFYDGYIFIKPEFKIQAIGYKNSNFKDLKYKYIPYLAMPYTLSYPVLKVYDNSLKKKDTSNYFNSEKEALEYAYRNEDFYYLQAIALLINYNYFDENFLFNKGYDHLINIENYKSIIDDETQIELIYTPQINKVLYNSNYKVDKLQNIDSNSNILNNLSVKIKENEKLNKEFNEINLDNKPFVEFYISIINLNPNIYNLHNSNKCLLYGYLTPFLISNTSFSLKLPNKFLIEYEYITQLLNSKNSLNSYNQYINDYFKENAGNIFRDNFNYKYFSEILVMTDCLINTNYNNKIKIYLDEKNILEKVNFVNYFYLSIINNSECNLMLLIYEKKLSFNVLFNSDTKTSYYLNFIFKEAKVYSNLKNNSNYIKELNNEFDNNILFKFCLFKINKKDNSIDINVEFIDELINEFKRLIEVYYYYIIKDYSKIINSNNILNNKETNKCIELGINLHSFNKLIDIDNYKIKTKIDNKDSNKLKYVFEDAYPNNIIKHKSIKYKNTTYKKYFKDKYNIEIDEAFPLKSCLKLNDTLKLILYNKHSSNKDTNTTDNKKKSKHIFNKTKCISIVSEYEQSKEVNQKELLLNNKSNLNIIDTYRIKIKGFSCQPKEVLFMFDSKIINLINFYFINLIPIITYNNFSYITYAYELKTIRNQFNSFKILNNVDISLFKKAITSKGANKEDNYENLEFLGDAILKFLASYEVFIKYPYGNKDLLFSKRKMIESNKALFTQAKHHKLEHYLKTINYNNKNFFNVFKYDTDYIEFKDKTIDIDKDIKLNNCLSNIDKNILFNYPGLSYKENRILFDIKRNLKFNKLLSTTREKIPLTENTNNSKTNYNNVKKDKIKLRIRKKADIITNLTTINNKNSNYKKNDDTTNNNLESKDNNLKTNSSKYNDIDYINNVIDKHYNEELNYNKSNSSYKYVSIEVNSKKNNTTKSDIINSNTLNKTNNEILFRNIEYNIFDDVDSKLEEICCHIKEKKRNLNSRPCAQKKVSDLTESLLAFVYNPNSIQNININENLNNCYNFLIELGLLTNTVQDIVEKINSLEIDECDKIQKIKNLNKGFNLLLLPDEYIVSLIKEDFYNINKKHKLNNSTLFLDVKKYLKNFKSNFYNFDLNNDKSLLLNLQLLTHYSGLSYMYSVHYFNFYDFPNNSIKIKDLMSKSLVDYSYSRLTFLGESLLSFYVSNWLYNKNKDSSEELLHKLKVSVLNIHILSSLSIKLNLDKYIICDNFKDKLINDLTNYSEKLKFLETEKNFNLKHIPELFKKYIVSSKNNANSNEILNENLFKVLNNSELNLSFEDMEELNKYKQSKIDMLLELDDYFSFPLIELFYSFCGAILLDTKCIETTYIILNKIFEPYLLANATINLFDEHPKTKIYYLFLSKINYLKKIKEK